MDKGVSLNEKIKAAAENRVAEYPRTEVFGNSMVRIEGHCGLAAYGREEMKINCGKIFIKVTGTDLELRAMNPEELAISGRIVTVEYVN